MKWIETLRLQALRSAWFKVRQHARSLVRFILMLVYAAVVAGLPAAAIYFLSEEMMGVVKDAISSKTITFAIAMVTLLLAELFYDWRYKIDPVQAFNKVEGNALAVGIFMGARAIAFGLVAALIYG